MADKDEASVFTPRQSLCRTPPSGVTILEDLPGSATGASKCQRESPGELIPAMRPRRDSEQREDEGDGDTAAGDESAERILRRASKEELMNRTHEAVKSIFSVVTGPGSKLNKSDTNSIATCGHDILAIVAALNLRLAEAELAAASAKLEAARAVRATGDGGAVASQTRTYASALKLAGSDKRATKEIRKPEAGPVMAIYPAAEQEDSIKTAEDTKRILKSAMDPTVMQVQVTKIRKVGRAGVVVQTTSEESAEKIKRAVPPTLRVTVPRSRKPLVALRNMLGNPQNDEVLNGVFEQNLRVKHPTWTADRFKAACRVAFKKSRRDRNITTVVLECTSELRDVLVALDRLFIGWESVVVCDYIDVTCCHNCQQYGHPAAHCRSKETVCGKCGDAGHKAADCKAAASRCATCHRFGRRDAEQHSTASRDCPARRYAEERFLSVTNYG
ncbi:Uncharacterized 50 kDa protein in type I retrotransposable element R1DM [Eumeta japonica]|uniref:Uncharacterized 50 kDa protein in type I retrotransposable element R1DM n=1 Tax=Eumeta variegata TaxID=151549 RepID=A0A4C1UQZ8_EUMVA|nr:Uncharacterized 50 kDa protein in type I retrotransposable element R1DM [Eumeta japonica]